jgi:hypothetical protein
LHAQAACSWLATINLLCQTYLAKKDRAERSATGEENIMTTELVTGLGLLIAFLAVVVAIIRGQSPIIMLLILAVLWAAIAGIGVDEIQKKIIQGGGVQYAAP